MNTGLVSRPRIYASVRVLCTYVLMCMLEGESPPPFAFYIYCNRTSLPGFAIGCYGNKGADWSGCSSESETQGEETERERQRFFFSLPASPDHNNRFLNSALRETRLVCGDDRQVEANRKIKMRLLLSYACIIIYTHMSKD